MSIENKCKYCAKVIPEDALICPYCHRKLRTSLFTKLSWIFILICLGILIYFQWMSPNKQVSKTKGIIQEVELTENGQEIKKAHSAWSNDDCNLIGEKKIRIGMNKDQVTVALGNPYRINKTSFGSSVHEKWIMNSSATPTNLYFENGILTKIQTSR